VCALYIPFCGFFRFAWLDGSGWMAGFLLRRMLVVLVPCAGLLLAVLCPGAAGVARAAVSGSPGPAGVPDIEKLKFNP